MNIKEIDAFMPLNKDLSKNQDPDKYSQILKEYHITIWSSRNLNGRPFILEGGYPNHMIYSNAGLSIVFTPDSITNIFQNSERKYSNKKTKEKDIVNQYYNEDLEIHDFIDEFNKIDYIIGSSLIFPIRINDIKLKWTLNIARGILYKVHDRIDLTLECIKRYMEDKTLFNPLRSSLVKNDEFFNLFSSFKEYVDFFLLNDLVDDNYNVIGLDGLLDFDRPFPGEKETFKLYLKNTLEFIKKRSQRIQNYIDSL